MINIEGLNKGDILAALYNNSKVQGMGFLQAREGKMNREMAEALLKQETYFDYLFGKVMKVDLSSDVEFEEWLYDRDNGSGSAKKVIDRIR